MDPKQCKRERLSEVELRKMMQSDFVKKKLLVRIFKDNLKQQLILFCAIMDVNFP
jgi:hypothetical protein